MSETQIELARGNAHVDAAIAGACNRIAPLWPLKHFVAVNPFLGFTNQTFHATCATFHRVARIEMLMTVRFSGKPSRRATSSTKISRPH